jgi:hypothetical protein
MKTTIIIEDAALATSSSERSEREMAAETPQPSTRGADVDAGAARVAGESATAPNGGSDGGTPPSWLIDAISAAGGLTAPPSPEGIRLGGNGNGATAYDAGAAPAR